MKKVFCYLSLSVVVLISIGCSSATSTPEVMVQPEITSTDTPTPIIDSTSTSEPPLLIVKVGFAYLRSEPDVNSPSISDAYPKGAKLEVLSVSRGWFYVRDLNSGETGWLYTDWIDLEATGDLDVIATPSFVPSPYPNP